MANMNFFDFSAWASYFKLSQEDITTYSEEDKSYAWKIRREYYNSQFQNKLFEAIRVFKKAKFIEPTRDNDYVIYCPIEFRNLFRALDTFDETYNIINSSEFNVSVIFMDNYNGENDPIVIRNKDGYLIGLLHLTFYQDEYISYFIFPSATIKNEDFYDASKDVLDVYSITPSKEIHLGTVNRDIYQDYKARFVNMTGTILSQIIDFNYL